MHCLSRITQQNSSPGEAKSMCIWLKPRWEKAILCLRYLLRALCRNDESLFRRLQSFEGKWIEITKRKSPSSLPDELFCWCDNLWFIVATRSNEW